MNRYNEGNFIRFIKINNKAGVFLLFVVGDSDGRLFKPLSLKIFFVFEARPNFPMPYLNFCP